MPLDYPTLATFYQTKQLIPILGNELLKIENGVLDNGDKRWQSFEQYLIEDKMGAAAGQPDYPSTYSELANQRPSIGTSDFIATYQQIGSARFDTGVLQKIADLPKFDFVINTTYDTKLEELMRANFERYGAEKYLPPEAIYWNHEKKDPLVFNQTNRTRKIVYLFGCVDTKPTYEEIAFSDEDRIECLFNIVQQSKNPSILLESFSLLEFLRGKKLLFIGNNFPDWFMRFLIRTLYNSPYRNNPSKAYIINDERTNVGFEDYFFKKYDIQITHDSPITNVIENLFTAIRSKETFKQKYNSSVFISYDRVNKEEASQLRNKLETKGIKTWLDERDLGIVAHQSEIKNTIGSNDTRVFLALLSSTLVQKTEAQSYTKRIEWRTADSRKYLNGLDINKGKMDPFYIVPVAIDDYKTYVAQLPEFISEINIKSLTDPTLTDDIEKMLN
jgi:hypothetical protein